MKKREVKNEIKVASVPFCGTVSSSRTFCLSLSFSFEYTRAISRALSFFRSLPVRERGARQKYVARATWWQHLYHERIAARPICPSSCPVASGDTERLKACLLPRLSCPAINRAAFFHRYIYLYTYNVRYSEPSVSLSLSRCLSLLFFSLVLSQIFDLAIVSLCPSPSLPPAAVESYIKSSEVVQVWKKKNPILVTNCQRWSIIRNDRSSRSNLRGKRVLFTFPRVKKKNTRDFSRYL